MNKDGCPSLAAKQIRKVIFIYLIVFSSMMVKVSAALK